MKTAYDAVWARLVFKFLERLEYGIIEISDKHGFYRRFGSISSTPSETEIEPAKILIDDWQIFRRIILYGDIAFGETYMESLWETPDLNHLLWVIGKNRKSLNAAIRGNRFTNAFNRIRHLLNKNTKKQARQNIEAHYDLGNNFYELWLDPSMTYSSAIQRREDGTKATDLEEAQHFKIRRALSQLGPLGDMSKTLEIGCGWGEMSKKRLEKFPGEHVGITLSHEQKEWTGKILNTHQLSDRNSTLLKDYRDISGQYDGIISIEMVEAVGKEYWDAFFAMIKKSLKPNGRAVIQAITINEALVSNYEAGVDFIQKYIFPGGMLMTKSQFINLADKHKFDVVNDFAFGDDYAWTLQQWFKNFHANWNGIESLGFNLRFKKMWAFYLSYCRSGFLNGDIDVVQYTLAHNSVKN